MNKGRSFENKLSLALASLTKKELGFFIKSPTPIRLIIENNQQKVIHAQKALCDFIGIFNTKFILLEAKEITNKRFELKRLKAHQMKQLSKIKQFGGQGIIIFNCVSMKKVIAVSIDDYLVYCNQTIKKSLNVETLIEIGTEIDLKCLENYFNQLTS
ncbi:MAG: hypothetical protein GQ557_00080 [Mycoplasmataceae bacterium]|nr:hypothetical protein [Mycoplasmataceae bacterium]